MLGFKAQHSSSRTFTLFVKEVLLPPWSHRGQLARLQFQCNLNLPACDRLTAVCGRERVHAKLDFVGCSSGWRLNSQHSFILPYYIV